MNGRIKLEETPEGRLAAAVESLNRQTDHDYRKNGHGPQRPDYVDYRETLRPWVKREELLVKMQVVKNLQTMTAASIESYLRNLTVELAKVNSALPEEYRL